MNSTSSIKKLVLAWWKWDESARHAIVTQRLDVCEISLSSKDMMTESLDDKTTRLGVWTTKSCDNTSRVRLNVLKYYVKSKFKRNQTRQDKTTQSQQSTLCSQFDLSIRNAYRSVITWRRRRFLHTLRRSRCTPSGTSRVLNIQNIMTMIVRSRFAYSGRGKDFLHIFPYFESTSA